MTGDGSAALSHGLGRRRVLAIGLAIALCAVIAPGAAGSSSSRLARANSRLIALTGQIQDQVAALDDLRAAVARADLRYERADRTLGLLLAARLRLRDRSEALRSAYDAAQARMHDAAVEAFMNSPGGTPGAEMLDIVLGAGSIADLQDRVAFGDAVADVQVRTAGELAVAATRLRAHIHDVEGLMTARRLTLDELAAARAQEEDALAAERAVWSELDATRTQLVDLIDELRRELGGENVAEVAAAFRGAEHVSFGRWADLLLRVLGAPTCRHNEVVVVAWQAQEFTEAAWNPLATTHRMPGSTDFNWVGVQNYVSLEQGLAATKETIDHGRDMYGYGAFVDDLKACSEPLATARSIAASSWCPGCLNGMYVVGVVPKVEADFATYAAL